jgi:hypothetical protein
LTVSASSVKEATPSEAPKAIAAVGEMRPLATGRSAVRDMVRSMSRSKA